MPAATNLQSLPLHAHGMPNWVDLHTARIDDARIFYEALLGWTFKNRFTLSAVPDHDVKEQGVALDTKAGSDSTTVMALCQDQPVADLVERNETFDDMALLSTWYPYVYVADLEATLKLVEPAGGLVINPPAKRGTTATVATILDPNDAMLCLWEPIGHSGTSVKHLPGSFIWIELETPDLDASKKFYGELFGWDAGEVSTGNDFLPGGGYTVFTKSGEPVAGAIETAMAGIPASWCPSFAVADVDQASMVAGRNGGVLMAEPSDIPVGRQAVIVDPTGAAFSVLGPKVTGPRPL
ncbi:MAG: VOC family protein [Acidimicrobiales bacterium]